MENNIEKHPFEPFLPQNAKVLFLGSFPPQEKRWSMKFYYPNYTNDFWYMIGLLWFNDKTYFTIPSEKRFDYDKITDFCRKVGFAMYDTATEVRRLKDNASDKFLEVIKPTDIPDLLKQIPNCNTIVTTGQKATDILSEKYNCAQPKIGESVIITIPYLLKDTQQINKRLAFYRMPSTSRAYPIPLVKKSEYYRHMFVNIGLL